MDKLNSTKPTIFHIIWSIPLTDELDKLIKSLTNLGFIKGEIITDLNYYNRYERFKNIFQMKDFDDVQSLNIEPNLEELIYDYENFSSMLVFINSYMGRTPTKIMTTEFPPDIYIDINYDILSGPLHNNELKKIPKIYLFDSAKSVFKPKNGHCHIQTMKPYLPGDYIDNTFVGFTIPTFKNLKKDTSFFKSIVENLHKNQKDKKSFQEIFKQTQLELKEEGIIINSIDDFTNDVFI